MPRLDNCDNNSATAAYIQHTTLESVLQQTEIYQTFTKKLNINSHAKDSNLQNTY